MLIQRAALVKGAFDPHAKPNACCVSAIPVFLIERLIRDEVLAGIEGSPLRVDGACP
jgi:hypothetical protein